MPDVSCIFSATKLQSIVDGWIVSIVTIECQIRYNLINVGKSKYYCHFVPVDWNSFVFNLQIYGMRGENYHIWFIYFMSVIYIN